ncbi:MAG: hypothetical protein ACP5HH_01755 [Fervidicoccaceae archaeon]
MRRMPWQTEIRLEKANELKNLCSMTKAAEDLVIEGLWDIWLDFDNKKILIPNELSEEIVENFRKKYEGIEIARLEGSFITGIPFKESYHYFIHKFSQIGRRAIKTIVDRTAVTGREHALFITDDGYGVAIEGEEERVLFPPSSLCIAIHTHPASNRVENPAFCFPSPSDMRNAIGFFLDGGLLFGIASSGFILYLQRTWIITEGQLDKISELPNKIEIILKKASKKPTDIFGELQNFLKGLPFELIIEKLELS